MGLTGLISEATIRLSADRDGVDAGRSRERTPDLDSTMARMAEADQQYRYSVSWIDCLARGRSLGPVGARVRRPRPAGRSPSRPAPAPPEPFASSRSTGPRRPRWAPSGLLNRWTVAAFNELWYRKSPRQAARPPGAGGRLLPPAGPGRRLEPDLRQPRASSSTRWWFPTAPRTPCAARSKALSDARCASFLAVLKRFGAANPGPLSFPRAGWTLALDLPAGAAGLALAARPARRDGGGRGRPGVPGQGLPAAARAARGHVPCPARLASRAGPAGSRTAGCARTWPAGFPACSTPRPPWSSLMKDALGAVQSDPRPRRRLRDRRRHRRQAGRGSPRHRDPGRSPPRRRWRPPPPRCEPRAPAGSRRCPSTRPTPTATTRWSPAPPSSPGATSTSSSWPSGCSATRRPTKQAGTGPSGWRRPTTSGRSRPAWRWPGR